MTRRLRGVEVHSSSLWVTEVSTPLLQQVRQGQSRPGGWSWWDLSLFISWGPYFRNHAWTVCPNFQNRIKEYTPSDLLETLGRYEHMRKDERCERLCWGRPVKSTALYDAIFKKGSWNLGQYSYGQSSTVNSTRHYRCTSGPIYHTWARLDYPKFSKNSFQSPFADPDPFTNEQEWVTIPITTVNQGTRLPVIEFGERKTKPYSAIHNNCISLKLPGNSFSFQQHYLQLICWA